MDLKLGDKLPLKNRQNKNEERSLSPASPGPLSPQLSSPCSETDPPVRPSIRPAPRDSESSVDGGPFHLVYDKFVLSEFTKYLEECSLDDKRDFMMDPLPKGTCIFCRVVREKKSGLASPLKRRRLILQTDEGIFLAASKKRGTPGLPEYVVSLEGADLHKDSKNYLGKLKSSLTGNECVAYDCGYTPRNKMMSPLTSPKTSKLSGKTITEEDMRDEMAGIRYVASFSNDPRQIQVVIPNLDLLDPEGNLSPVVPKKHLFGASDFSRSKKKALNRKLQELTIDAVDPLKATGSTEEKEEKGSQKTNDVVPKSSESKKSDAVPTEGSSKNKMKSDEVIENANENDDEKKTNKTKSKKSKKSVVNKNDDGNASDSSGTPSEIPGDEYPETKRLDPTKSLYEFVSRKPLKSPRSGTYTLDFGDRVTKASVKNFQLVHVDDREGDHSTTYFQFGRMTDDEFALDFAHPFSPFQAFCIALSSMEFKFAA